MYTAPRNVGKTASDLAGMYQNITKIVKSGAECIITCQNSKELLQSFEQKASGM